MTRKRTGKKKGVLKKGKNLKISLRFLPGIGEVDEGDEQLLLERIEARLVLSIQAPV